MALLTKQKENKDFPEEVPLIPLRQKVVFPGTLVSLAIGRPRSKAALDEALKENRQVVFVCQKRPINNPNQSDLYSVGTLSLVRRFWKVNGDYNLTIEGLSRVFLKDFLQTKPSFSVEIEEIPEIAEKSEETEAIIRNIMDQMKRYGEVGGSLSLEASISIFSAEDSPNQLVNAIASGVHFKPAIKQEILETTDTKARLLRITELLGREIKVLGIGRKIAADTQKRVGKTTRKAILKEQLRSIKKELGEDKKEETETKSYRKKIKAAKMPAKVKKKALHELKRLAKMHTFNPEASYLRGYLDWLCSLPWKKLSKNKVSIKRAEKVLDKDHYGLKKVKERIIEYLAVHKLAGKIKGPILCFVGPPGTGKTSVGRSIARALGRKFVRISLGGIRDEAEIRGHRRTYVGALPGRIIQGVKSAGTRNPVFMLDEIDKVGKDFRGDPSAALLETLDPEQNNAFSDHYLEVPFDLSDVMFITTANVLETIPPALKDRLEVIRFAGYTQDEKFQIGKKFLWPKQVEAHGLKKSQIKVTDDGLVKAIKGYTREAGVRELERTLAALCRKVAKKIAEKKAKSWKIKPSDVTKFLGPIKFTALMAEKKDDVGMATGLAVTQAGGEILNIEVGLMPGKGKLLLTGHLGDVMKESCQAAMSYVRAHAIKLGLEKKFYQKIDAHVHVPQGAVPKDGPSAGIAIAAALVSALTETKIKKEVAMSGEITLRGRAMEVGGIKEKVLAAHRAGLKTVILPKNNKKDLVEVPDKTKKALEFVFVKTIDEVLEEALVKLPGKKKKKKKKTKKKNSTKKKS